MKRVLGEGPGRRPQLATLSNGVWARSLQPLLSVSLLMISVVRGRQLRPLHSTGPSAGPYLTPQIPPCNSTFAIYPYLKLSGEVQMFCILRGEEITECICQNPSNCTP